MKYLNVHGNYNNLHFDEGLFKRIKEQTRGIDTVSLLKEELETLLKN